MGEVIDIFNPDNRLRGEVSNFEFNNAIRSEHVATLTSDAIGELIKTPSFKLPGISSKLVEPEKVVGRQGSCYVFKPNSPEEDVSFLVADASFPNYLVENDVSRNDAVTAAAVFVRSIDFLDRVFASTNTWHRSETMALQRVQNSGMRDIFWPENVRRLRLATQYRAAGSISVCATGIDVDPSDKPPYTPHIAGLVDPLKASAQSRANGTFLELQEVITASIN